MKKNQTNQEAVVKPSISAEEQVKILEARIKLLESELNKARIVIGANYLNQVKVG